MRLVLGVDVGGSKTIAAVADLGGRVVGVGRGPGGNRQTVGATGFRDAVDAAVTCALAAAGSRAAHVARTHVGAAGVDFPEDRDELHAALGADYGDVVVENDALLGLHAASTWGWGGVVVAGFGANAVARSKTGEVAFVGGAGWHAGDRGGLSTLGIEGVRLAIRSWEGRDPPSILGERLCAAGRLAGMDELFRAVATYQGPDSIVAGRLVMEAAEDGDVPCRRLVESFGTEMGLSAGIALGRVGIAGDEPEVVAMGGMVRMAAGLGGRAVGSVLLASFEEELLRIAPSAAVRILETEPVAGAVLAALRAAGGDADPADLGRQIDAMREASVA